MAKTPDKRYGTRLAGWVGIVIATTIPFPASPRFPGREFGWPDVLLAAAGAVLLVFRAVRLVLPERALRSHAGIREGS